MDCNCIMAVATANHLTVTAILDKHVVVIAMSTRGKLSREIL